MGWDKNLDYKDEQKRLKNAINDLLKDRDYLEGKGKAVKKQTYLYLAYTSILYIQLHNGARISEVIEGIMKFMNDGKREQRVKTKKRIKRVKNDIQKELDKLNILYEVLPEDVVNKIRKIRKETMGEKKQDIIEKGTPATQLIFIKKDIEKGYFDILEGRTPHQIQNGVCIFALNHYKINTHSLRYAFINQAGKEGVPSNIISSAIRHSSPDTIAAYTREQAGDDLIRRMNEQ